MGKRFLKTLTAATATGIALLMLPGMAAASIPSGDQVFTACMLKDVGTVRLIDPSLPARNLLGHCSRVESQVHWNAQGPAGPQGPKGDTGATGPQGPQGDTGPQGPAGDKGATGPQGPAGADGAPGKDGATGQQGPQGDTGPRGPAGQNGAPGADGVSVTSVKLNPGDDPQCPNGGSKFTAVGGSVSYACNAKDASPAAAVVGAVGHTTSADGITLGTIPGFGSVRISTASEPNLCAITFVSNGDSIWATLDSNADGQTTIVPHGSYSAMSAQGTLQGTISLGEDYALPGGRGTGPLEAVHVDYYMNYAHDPDTGQPICTGGITGTLAR